MDKDIRPIVVFDSTQTDSIVCAAIAMYKDRNSIPLDIARQSGTALKKLIKANIKPNYGRVYMMVDGMNDLIPMPKAETEAEKNRLGRRIFNPPIPSKITIEEIQHIEVLSIEIQ